MTKHRTCISVVSSEMLLLFLTPQHNRKEQVVMMRRTQCRLSSTKALSPYAQALKHIAIRGAVALGPSAREQDIAMYLAGNLPADYRPPVQGKWDDTIERWAYAWQFPATEGGDEASHDDVLKSQDFPKLRDFCQKLLTSPPSKLPGSAVGSKTYPMIDRARPQQSSLPQAEDVRNNLLLDSPIAEERHAFYDDLEKQLVGLNFTDASNTNTSSDPIVVDTPDTPTAAPASDAVAVDSNAFARMQSAMSYAAVSGVPAAYLDDGSELSIASKSLAALMEHSFTLAYEEPGLIVVLNALTISGAVKEARALFDFIKDVGLGPNAEMYRSLMKAATKRADVNQSMTIIEEMKEAGITPRIGNWHELMRCFHAAKDYPAVQQVVDHMKAYANIEPNEATFALQLQALSKDHTQLSTLPEAVQLFDQMENVYGFIASRPHYHALLSALCQSPSPDHRQRCELLGKKMELMGIVWDQKTFLYHIMSAQVVGDLKAIEALFGKMRNENITMTVPHLAWAIHGHVQALIRLDFKGMKERNEDPVAKMLELISTCYGVYQLVIDRGWRVERILVNAMLRLACQSAILCIEHVPEDTKAMGRLEAQAKAIWTETFDEVGATRDVYSYETYIALLAHQQRIDEAEKLFQELCLRDNATPSRRTYETLIFMHLSSGEEGGAARALHYLEAMERANISIRPSLIKKIVRVNDAAGYKRDMKRRARRIMQAREEYIARKEEGFDMSPKPYEQPQRDAEGNLVAVPLPINPGTTLAWWEKWKRESISKHELFDTEAADGSPRGESFEEKNAALLQMGIESKFPTKDLLPKRDQHRLLPKLRAKEGEVTGALWGLDGGDLSYPSDGAGPNGWGVRLWRDRQLIQKEFDAVQSSSQAGTLALSEAGNSLRSVPDQMLIENSGAKTVGALSDAKQFAMHVYDDGTSKPLSEFAVDVPPSAELVWQQERNDRLSPYKTDDELSAQADSTFHAALSDESDAKVNATIRALQEGRENLDDIRGSSTTRRTKHDYLEKWRGMYTHGTLEVPDEPLERYGLDPNDHKHTVSRTVKAHYARSWEKKGKGPASDEDLERWTKSEERDDERRSSRRLLKSASVKRRRRRNT